MEEPRDGARGGENDGGEGLKERFTELWEAHSPRVRAIVGASGCEDPEALVGEVARKAWQAFGTTVKRERRRVTEGWPGYNWRSWFARMTERVVIDARRRARTARRAYGYRAEMATLGREAGADGGGSQDEGESGGPLDVDMVADGAPANDPAVAAERAEAAEALRRALGTLTDDEVCCLVGWARGEQNWETAAAIGMSWKTLVSVRARAISKVREEMERLGLGWALTG